VGFSSDQCQINVVQPLTTSKIPNLTRQGPPRASCHVEKGCATSTSSHGENLTMNSPLHCVCMRVWVLQRGGKMPSNANEGHANLMALWQERGEMCPHLHCQVQWWVIFCWGININAKSTNFKTNRFGRMGMSQAVHGKARKQGPCLTFQVTDGVVARKHLPVVSKPQTDLLLHSSCSRWQRWW